MLPTDMEHYVSEIVRVLKPNGRSLCTFLLLNDESMRFMNAGFSTPFDFKQFAKNHRVITPEEPEVVPYSACRPLSPDPINLTLTWIQRTLKAVSLMEEVR